MVVRLVSPHDNLFPETKMLRAGLLPVLLTITMQSDARRQTLDTTRVQADTLGRFPTVEGRNLEGRAFRLPEGLAGELNIVLIAFLREQQRDVDSWMPFLAPIAASRPEVKVYELPTLGRGYRVVRSFIDGGMRGGIPDRAVRETTITLYIDKSPFRKSLRLADERRIHILVVTRDGRVLWRADGPFDAAAGESLHQFLARERS